MRANRARSAWFALRICARGSDVYLRNQWMDPRIDESRLDAFGACRAPWCPTADKATSLIVGV